MGKGTTISFHHVTRVEGHGNIVVDLEDGTLTRCELQIVESPHYFEALLKDRPCEEAPRITCRICGICSVGHASASIHAVEAALGASLGPKTRALRLKGLANEICYAICGRHLMPISYVAGGMGHGPTPPALEALRTRLDGARPDIEATVELFSTIEWPELEQDLEALAALPEDGSYPMMGGGRSTRAAGRYTRRRPTVRRAASTSSSSPRRSTPRAARGRFASARCPACSSPSTGSTPARRRPPTRSGSRRRRSTRSTTRRPR